MIENAINWVMSNYTSIINTVAVFYIALQGFVNKVKNNKLSLEYKNLHKGNSILNNSFTNTDGKINNLQNIIEKLLNTIELNTEEQAKKDELINKLINTNVATLTVANVPIAQKEKYYNLLLGIDSVSDLAKETLKSSIDSDKKKSIETSGNFDKVDELLKGV